MLIKVKIFCKNCQITGNVDAPKIKKRMGRNHFGLLALLNYPKLASEWLKLRKDLLVIEDAQVTTHEGKLIQNAPRVYVPPAHILYAFEIEGSEAKNVMTMINSSDQVVFQTANQLKIAGECGEEVNEVTLNKGKGFLSLANASIEDANGEEMRLPFLVINHHHMKPVRRNLALRTAQGKPLAKPA